MQLMVPIVQVRGNILLSASVRREIIEGSVLWMAGRVNMWTNKRQQLFDVQSSTEDKQDPDAEQKRQGREGKNEVRKEEYKE